MRERLSQKSSFPWPYWAYVLLTALIALVSGCKREAPQSNQGATSKDTPARSESKAPATNAEPIVVKLAYGSEKKSWLTEAMKRFNASNPHLPSGEPLRVEGTAVGSGAAVEDLVDGSTRVHAWAPASSPSRSGPWRSDFDRRTLPFPC